MLSQKRDERATLEAPHDRGRAPVAPAVPKTPPRVPRAPEAWCHSRLSVCALLGDPLTCGPRSAALGAQSGSPVSHRVWALAAPGRRAACLRGDEPVVFYSSIRP